MLKIIKNILKQLVILLLLTQKLEAQFPNPLNFNTATNATNTGTLAVGANDLHWTAALTNSLGPYVPAVVCGNQAPCCWINSPFPNANWITYPHTCSPGPAEHSCLGNVDEYYMATLNLPSLACNQSITTPSAYCLSLDFFADNWVSEVFVNNVLSFNNPNANAYNAMGFLNPVTVSLCNNWQVGTNTIIVHVKSGAPSFPGWTGFLAQANQTVNPSIGIPVTATVSQNNVSCFGGNNGSATVVATGGNAPFTYTWLPTGGNSSTTSNLTSGIYSVMVSNSNGCITTQTINITQPAPINITVPANTVVCNGGTISLTAGGANTYTWSNGSNNATTIVNATGIYTVTGTNTVTGCTGSNTVSIQTGNNPTVNVISNGPVCEGSIVTFTANGAATYNWSNGGSGNIITLIAQSNTIVSVTGFDAGHVCFDTKTISVSVLPSPNINILGNSGICEGSSLTLTASGATSYTWNNSSTSNTILISPTITTNYSITGTSVNGCTNIATTQVIVSKFPALSVTGGSVCQGESITLQASGATTYTWSDGNHTSSTNVSPLINTIYTVSGSGTLPFCTATQTVQVFVMPAPSLTLTSFPSLAVCEGKAVTLTVKGANLYLWSNGSISENITVYPTSNTTYTVIGTIFGMGCKSTKTIQVKINAIPSITILPTSNACEGDLITLQAIGANTYVWNNAQTTPTINVVLSENAIYQVTGMDVLTGCAGTTSIELEASNSCCEFFIPNTFTPNEDGHNEEFGPKTLCKFSKYKFMIFDRWGEKIFETSDQLKYWNGYYKNEICQDDVYVYIIEAEKQGKNLENKYIYKTGHVNLLK